MTNSYFMVNTSNSFNGWTGWPFTSWEVWWEGIAITGVSTVNNQQSAPFCVCLVAVGECCFLLVCDKLYVTNLYM